MPATSNYDSTTQLPIFVAIRNHCEIESTSGVVGYDSYRSETWIFVRRIWYLLYVCMHTSAAGVMREVVNHNEMSATRKRYLDVHNIPS